MTEFENLILEFLIRKRTQQFTLMPLCSVSRLDVGNGVPSGLGTRGFDLRTMTKWLRRSVVAALAGYEIYLSMSKVY